MQNSSLSNAAYQSFSPVRLPSGRGDDPNVRPLAGVPTDGFEGLSQRDWLELVRDVVATANSGGGQIRMAMAAKQPVDGRSIYPDADSIRAELLGPLERYTGVPFTDVSAAVLDDGASTELLFRIGPAGLPVGFIEAGSCSKDDKAADGLEMFPAGSFYFRHGDRSEPGTQADMQASFARVLRQVRREWLRGIRRVIKAPTERALRPVATASVVSEQAGRSQDLRPVRIVDDPAAPALQPQDVEHLYPWRQKELLHELNRRLGRRALNSYDIQAVRRQHRLDDRPDFVFRLAGAGRRYSPVVADWMMNEYERNPAFFQQARAADHEAMKVRRRKPH